MWKKVLLVGAWNRRIARRPAREANQGLNYKDVGATNPDAHSHIDDHPQWMKIDPRLSEIPDQYDPSAYLYEPGTQCCRLTFAVCRAERSAQR